MLMFVSHKTSPAPIYFPIAPKLDHTPAFKILSYLDCKSRQTAARVCWSWRHLTPHVALSNGRVYIGRKLASLLLKASKVAQRQWQENSGFIFPFISREQFKMILDYLSKGNTRQSEEHILTLLEGLSLLECREATGKLERNLCAHIKSYELTERNFANTLKGYFWARKWGLELAQSQCRIFFQNYIRANFRNKLKVKHIKNQLDWCARQEEHAIPLAVCLSKPEFSPHFFEVLKYFAAYLVSIKLKSLGSVKEENLEDFRSFLNLTSLTIQCEIKQKGLIHLQPLTKLSTLDLSGSELPDQDLACLQALPDLTVLKLQRCITVTEVGLRNLSQLKLTFFSFGGSRSNLRCISEGELEAIASITTLRTLVLKATTIKDVQIKKLHPLNLTRLNLSHSHFLRDWGLEFLQGLTSITDLSLNKCGIYEGGLRFLASLSNIESLSLKELEIVDSELGPLSALPRLSKLNVAGCKNLTHTAPLSKLTALTALNLSHTSVTDAGVERLTALSQLTFVDLSNSNVTKKGLENIADHVHRNVINNQLSRRKSMAGPVQNNLLGNSLYPRTTATTTTHTTDQEEGLGALQEKDKEKGPDIDDGFQLLGSEEKNNVRSNAELDRKVAESAYQIKMYMDQLMAEMDAKQNQRIVEINTNLESQEMEITLLREDITQRNSEIGALKEDINKRNLDIEALKIAQAKQEHKIRKLSQAKQRLKERVEEIDKLREIIHQKDALLEKKNLESREELETVKAGLEKKLKQKDETIHKQRLEIERLRKSKFTLSLDSGNGSFISTKARTVFFRTVICSAALGGAYGVVRYINSGSAPEFPTDFTFPVSTLSALVNAVYKPVTVQSLQDLIFKYSTGTTEKFLSAAYQPINLQSLHDLILKSLTGASERSAGFLTYMLLNPNWFRS